MENLVILGLAAAVLLAAAGSVFTGRAQPPQVIYVQVAPEAQGGGGFGLLVLVVVVVLAVVLM